MSDNVIVRVPEQQFIRGEDGYSPEVTIENIDHGHSVNITDREHPEGQTFNVMDGDSAYEQAVAGGYTGTEEQFNEDLSSFKTLHDDTEDAAPFYAIYGVTTISEISSALNRKGQVFLRTLEECSVAPFTTEFMWSRPGAAGRGFRFAKIEGTVQHVYELTDAWTSYTNDLSAPADRAEEAAAQALNRMNSADTSAQAAEAAQEAAEAALANIPEDYSDLSAKLENIRTPEQYGAVGDGVTDDSSALQACLNDGGAILLGKEYYIGSAQLTANNQVEIICTADSKIIADPFEYTQGGSPSPVLILNAAQSRVYGLRVFSSIDYVGYGSADNVYPTYIEVNSGRTPYGAGSNRYAIFVNAPRCVIRDLYGAYCSLIRLGNDVTHEGCVIDGLYGDFVEIGIYAATATNVIVNNVRINVSRFVLSQYYHVFYFCNPRNCTFSNVVVGASGDVGNDGSTGDVSPDDLYVTSDIFHFNFNTSGQNLGGDVVVTNATAIDGCFNRFTQVTNNVRAYFTNCTGVFKTNICLLGMGGSEAVVGDPSATFIGCTFRVTNSSNNNFAFRCSSSKGRIWLRDCKIVDETTGGYLVSGGVIADGCTFEAKKWKVNVYTSQTYTPPALATFNNCTIKADALDTNGISPSVSGFKTEYHDCVFVFDENTPAQALISDTNESTILVVGGSVENCGRIFSGTGDVTVIDLPYKYNGTWSIFSTQTWEDIANLYEQKQDKPKSYTAISGTFHEGAMWKYSTSEEVSNSSYIYAVITSGFTAGETYAFDAYQPSSTNVYAAIAFYNSNNQLIDKVVLSSSASAVKYEALVPENTTAIYINAIKSRGFPGMYAFSYSDADIYGIVASNEFSASNWMDRRYQDGEFEQYTAKTPDHLVVTFSVDDSYPDISDIATAFATAGVPLCLATIPEYLDVVCNNGDTVLEVCQDVQSHGGEILTHNHNVLGANSTPEQYLKYFVTSKKALVDAGLTVNGIIKAGGTEPGGPPSVPAMLRYLRSYYDYGTGFSTVGDGRFIIGRGHLKADTDFDAIKAQIDAASSGGIKNFYTHGQADFPGDNAWVDKIMDLVNYILSNPNAEIVTIGDMFRNNYAKSFKS